MLQQKSLIKLVHTVFYLIKSSIKKKKSVENSHLSVNPNIHELISL